MKKYWKEITLICLAYLFCVHSWLYFPSFDSHETWFARSGAIMVLLAVIVEYQLAGRSYEQLGDSIAISSIGIPNSPNQPCIEKYLSRISHLAIILGTLIWGYGDIVKHITST